MARTGFNLPDGCTNDDLPGFAPPQDNEAEYYEYLADHREEE